MVREDLVEGAVSLLQDPSVSTAPLEQKIAFLRSKNLTQEEIDLAFARAGQPPSASQPALQPNYPTQSYRPQQYAYQQQPYWTQPPPEIPRRDWRDWFIMATVVGGVSYAVYWTARRYVYPLIAPPTKPQLEQDIASVNEAFDKSFALLEQLAKDTEALKASEQARTERLDQALSEVENVLSKLKEANEARELESRSMARELLEVKDQIPKAVEREKKGLEEKLEAVVGEMKSLKTLVANRMQTPAPQVQPPAFGQVTQPSYVRSQSRLNVNGVAGTAATASESDGSVDGEGGKASPSPFPDRAPDSPFNRFAGAGKAQIPAWQLEAKKRSEAAKTNANTDGAATSQPPNEEASTTS